MIRTVFGWALILVATLVFALGIGICGETRASEAILRAWARLFLWVAGARVKFAEDPSIDPKGSYVYVSNHTSNLDVPAILSVAHRPLRFIAKKELRLIPLFGWAAVRMGHVFVDRRDSQGAAKAIKKRIERSLDGVSLLFFAEGTRSTTRELLPFKKGAAIAAITTGLDCVPVAVAGAREVMKPKGFAPFAPGPVAVVFGKPVAVAGHSLESRDALVAAQRGAVEETVRDAERLLTEDRVSRKAE